MIAYSSNIRWAHERIKGASASRGRTNTCIICFEWLKILCYKQVYKENWITYHLSLTGLIGIIGVSHSFLCARNHKETNSFDMRWGSSLTFHKPSTCPWWQLKMFEGVQGSNESIPITYSNEFLLIAYRDAKNRPWRWNIKYHGHVSGYSCTFMGYLRIFLTKTLHYHW